MRWHRRALVMLVTLGLGMVLMGQAPGPASPEQVRAQRFVLADGAGTTRGTWSLEPDGTALFQLADGQRRARASLSVGPEGATALRLYDDAGNRRAVLGSDASGSSVALELLDPRGPQRLALGLGAGGASVVLLAPDGKRAARLAVGDESPRLALSDKQGIDRLWVALRADSPAIQFFDGGRVARSGLTTFNDERGVAVVSESDATSHGLILYGKNRDVVWSAP